MMTVDVLLTPPDAAEVRILGRGVVSAVSGPDGLTDLQKIVIAAVFHSMTGHDLDVDAVQPIGAAEFADALARRNQIFRTRIVQVMLLAAFVVRPCRKASPSNWARSLTRSACTTTCSTSRSATPRARWIWLALTSPVTATCRRSGRTGWRRCTPASSAPPGARSWTIPASRRAGDRWR